MRVSASAQRNEHHRKHICPPSESDFEPPFGGHQIVFIFIHSSKLSSQEVGEVKLWSVPFALLWRRQDPSQDLVLHDGAESGNLKFDEVLKFDFAHLRFSGAVHGTP